MSVTEDLSIEDYLNWQAVDYKSTSGVSGAQLNLRECPNPDCGNSKWKVYVGAETGLGKCHACDKGYNKWTLIADLTGKTKRELIDHINDVKRALGHKVDTRKRKTIVTAAVELDKLELPESFELPTKSGENARYLEERGVTGEYAAYFHLRYCHDAWHRYTKEDGSKGGQNCGGRIIIPIFDLEGDLVTFQGRDITGEAENKYLFPAKLPGAGRYLYNGHNAYALGAEEVIVNEGAFDVFATKRVIDAFEGMKGIVPIGTFGKHLSVSHDGVHADQISGFLRLKARGLKRVTIMWDGEEAALTSALLAGEALMKIGLAVRIALLPAGKDPDEADQIEVYHAWMGAVPLTPASAARLRLRNPYKRKKPCIEL